jgi:signal transduction histidine kinase
VADQGPGIPDGEAQRVFERFYRADAARASSDGGAGLGLAIARKLVEDHGGRIEARSEVGRGSTFTVRLPLAGGRRPSPRALAGA